MFRGCVCLESIDLSNFNMQNVSNAYYMFRNCISLKSINFGNFNIKNIEWIDGMFVGDSNELQEDIKCRFPNINLRAFEESGWFE